jgi:hypothetical protein
MSSQVKGNQVRNNDLGYQVVKTGLTPPNSGSTSTLFTVSTGMVYVTSLIGRVTTAMSGTTGAIALGTAPTGSTANTAGIATAGVIGGAEIGTLVTPIASSGLAGALVVGSSKQAGAAVWVSTPFIVNVGTITITTSVATMTGALSWYITYLPVDNGAYVS